MESNGLNSDKLPEQSRPSAPGGTSGNGGDSNGARAPGHGEAAGQPDVFWLVREAVENTIAQTRLSGSEKEAQMLQRLYDSTRVAGAEMRRKVEQGEPSNEVAKPLLGVYQEIRKLIWDFNHGASHGK